MDKAASIFLRAEINENDAEHLLKWLNDPGVTVFLSDDSRSADHVRYLIESVPPYLWQMNLNSGGRFYMIDCGKKPIGFIRLSEFDSSAYEIVIALGDKRVWGNGYGAAALDKCLRLAFFEHRADSIVANIHTENIRSLRLFEKARFKMVARQLHVHRYRITLNQFIA